MPHPLDGLDPGQRAAVVHRGGPLLVEGEAGTGKTRVLAHRVAWLASEGLAPHAALVLTGSRRAALDLQCRIEGLLPPGVGGAGGGHPGRLGRAGAARARRRSGARPALGARDARRPRRAAARPAGGADAAPPRDPRQPRPVAGPGGAPDRPSQGGGHHRRRLRELGWELAALARDDAERAHAVRELEFARLYADHDRLLAGARRARPRRRRARPRRPSARAPARARRAGRALPPRRGRRPPGHRASRPRCSSPSWWRSTAS